MPELPEVECLSVSIKQVLAKKKLKSATFYRKDLREEIPIAEFKRWFVGKEITQIDRRSKYILIKTEDAISAVHLGMSGNIFFSSSKEPTISHTHFVLEIDSKQKTRYLHYVDPRRFGSLTCFRKEDFADHRLFKHLGPEPLPLAPRALGEHLWKAAQGKKVAIKNFLMDAKNVVGVGNIYASESLFRAGIHPKRAAMSVTRPEFDKLAKAIQVTLKMAIEAGGTSFKDYRHADGSEGYFAVKLNVYDRKDRPCTACGRSISHEVLGGRATYFCEGCQK
jgi:formamidopyrimidine-DNA glycosylase